MSLQEQLFDGAEALPEACVARLGVEREELDLPLRLRDVELARHLRDDRAERLSLDPLEDDVPRDHEEPARHLCDDGGSRRPSAKKIRERSREVARQIERARALGAVGQREELAEDAALQERDVLGTIARVEEGLSRREPNDTHETLEGEQLVVAERGELAEASSPPHDVFAARSRASCRHEVTDYHARHGQCGR